MSTHTIRVRNGTATPTPEPVAVGDVVKWVGPPGSTVGIYFGPKTPVGWQSNNGPTVTGIVQSVPFDSYPYKPGHSFTASESEPEPAVSDEPRPMAEPELIVSGGLQPKRKRTTRTKRVATKRAKTKSAKTTRRAKSTKRAKATTRAKPTKRTKATKRAKPAKRAKR